MIIDILKGYFFLTTIFQLQDKNLKKIWNWIRQGRLINDDLFLKKFYKLAVNRI